MSGRILEYKQKQERECFSSALVLADGLGDNGGQGSGVLAVEDLQGALVTESLAFTRLELGADGGIDLGAGLVAGGGRDGSALAVGNNLGKGSRVLAVEDSQGAGVGEGLGLTGLELGTDGSVFAGAGLVADGGRLDILTGGLGNKGGKGSRVLTVEDAHLARVTEGLGLAGLELGTDRLVDLGAGLVANGGRGGGALAVDNRLGLGAGVLAVVNFEGALVAKGLGLAREELGANWGVDLGAGLVALGGNILASGLGNEGGLVGGVLAVEHVHLANVGEGLVLTGEEFGTDGLVNLGAGLVADGNGGGGHGGEDGHRGDNGQGDDGRELHFNYSFCVGVGLGCVVRRVAFVLKLE